MVIQIKLVQCVMFILNGLSLCGVWLLTMTASAAAPVGQWLRRLLLPKLWCCCCCGRQTDWCGSPVSSRLVVELHRCPNSLFQATKHSEPTCRVHVLTRIFPLDQLRQQCKDGKDSAGTGTGRLEPLVLLAHVSNRKKQNRKKERK